MRYWDTSTLAKLYVNEPELDGIHLATADLHNAAEVIATDANLRKCAVSLGLQVYP